MRVSVANLIVSIRNKTILDIPEWSATTGIHALLGPNGAGKSTFLSVLATLRQPTTGTITFNAANGFSISDSELRGHVGYLPQENLPASRLRVREHLEYLCWLRKIPTTQVPQEVERLLEIADLSERAEERISALSGGMRRRLGLASAVTGSPPLVLLDEPSAGLDLEQRTRMSATLLKLAENAIVLTSTHIVEDVINIAEKVSILSQGRFIHTSTWAEFSQGSDLSTTTQHYLDLVAR